jgi:hypothetical protein
MCVTIAGAAWRLQHSMNECSVETPLHPRVTLSKILAHIEEMKKVTNERIRAAATDRAAAPGCP